MGVARTYELKDTSGVTYNLIFLTCLSQQIFLYQQKHAITTNVIVISVT